MPNIKNQNHLDIPCLIEYSTSKINGVILQLTLTGVMVELDKVLFRPGNKVIVHIDPDNRKLNITEELRSIKNYENFYRKDYTAAQRKKLKIQPKSLAELHFVKLQEHHYLKLKRYLDSLSSK